MDFLKKIKNFFKRKKRFSSFHEQVQQEKKQKYLFRNDVEDGATYNRGKKKGLFRISSKKKKKDKKYSNFFQNILSRPSSGQDIYYLMGGIGVFLLLLVSYIIIVSPYFKISPNKVLIEPLTQGVDLNIVHRSIENIYNKSIFSLDEKSIAKQIKENLKNTEKVTIERIFPNGAKILIKSFPIQYDTTILGIENKRWGISDNGVLIPMNDIKDENFSHHLSLISKELQSEIFLNYKKVLSDKTMFLINKLFELFASQWSDFKIARANYFLIENELHIILESNTKIILALQSEYENNNRGFSKTLLNELITLQTYINNNREKVRNGGITYLDVRIPGKVFVCTDEAQCKKNLILIYGDIYNTQ